MVLYHATTAKRAKKILESGIIKRNIDRFYTEELNGEGYSTDGYVYLSNEITYAMHFANCHTLVDKSESIYVFKMEIDDSWLEADYDEIRHESISKEELSRYNSDLEYTLMQFMACRVSNDLFLKELSAEYCIVPKNGKEKLIDIIGKVGADYDYTIHHYTALQKRYLRSIKWYKI